MTTKRAALAIAIVCALASSAKAFFPPPSTEVYPADGRATVPANAQIRLLSVYDHYTAADLSIVGATGVVAVDVTIDSVQPGWFESFVLTPQTQLPAGDYSLVRNDQVQPTTLAAFTVTTGDDHQPPGLPTNTTPTISHAAENQAFAAAINLTLTFDPADDDRTPATKLAYNVYLASTPQGLDTNGPPALPARVAKANADGSVTLVVSEQGGTIPRTPLTPTTWYVAIRAVDEAGNVGPASAVMTVNLAPPASSGCAVGAGGSVSLVTVLFSTLWLLIGARRRRAA